MIEEVTQALRDGTLLRSPHLAAEYRSRLSGEYSYLMGLLEKSKDTKAEVWLELRKQNKSDTSTERAYELTEDGRNEVRLRSELKRVEKLLTGLSTIIKDAENEAKNLY